MQSNGRSYDTFWQDKFNRTSREYYQKRKRAAKKPHGKFSPDSYENIPPPKNLGTIPVLPPRHPYTGIEISEEDLDPLEDYGDFALSCVNSRGTMKPAAQRYFIWKYWHTPYFKRIVKFLKKVGYCKSNKSFENLGIGNKKLKWCRRCGIRKISDPERKTCDNCHRVVGPPSSRDQDKRCVYVYKYKLDSFEPGEQCNQWAIKGTTKCLKHSPTHEGNHHRWGKRLTVDKYYHYALGPALQEYMEQALDQAPEEMYDVKQELTLARASALPLTKYYSDQMEWNEENIPKLKAILQELVPPLSPEQEDRKKQILRTIETANTRLRIAGDNLRAALDKITEISQRGNEIYLKHVKTISPDQVQMMVSQIVKIVGDVCGAEFIGVASEITRLIKEEIRLPSQFLEDQQQSASHDVDSLIQDMVSTMGFLEHSDAQS